MRRKIYCLFCVMVVMFGVYAEPSRPAKEKKLPIETLSRSSEFIPDLETAQILIVYNSYFRDNFEIITKCKLFILQNNEKTMIGGYTLEKGFLNSVGEVINNPKKYYRDMLGLSDDFLKEPKNPTVISLYEAKDGSYKLFKTDVINRLSYDAESKSIYEWFPKWD